MKPPLKMNSIPEKRECMNGTSPARHLIRVEAQLQWKSMSWRISGWGNRRPLTKSPDRRQMEFRRRIQRFLEQSGPSSFTHFEPGRGGNGTSSRRSESASTVPGSWFIFNRVWAASSSPQDLESGGMITSSARAGREMPGAGSKARIIPGRKKPIGGRPEKLYENRRILNPCMAELSTRDGKKQTISPGFRRFDRLLFPAGMAIPNGEIFQNPRWVP